MGDGGARSNCPGCVSGMFSLSPATRTVLVRYSSGTRAVLYSRVASPHLKVCA